VEEIDIDEESLAYLGEIGQQTSLRLDFCVVLWHFPRIPWISFSNMGLKTQVLGS